MVDGLRMRPRRGRHATRYFPARRRPDTLPGMTEDGSGLVADQWRRWALVSFWTTSLCPERTGWMSMGCLCVQTIEALPWDILRACVAVPRSPPGSPPYGRQRSGCRGSRERNPGHSGCGRRKSSPSPRRRSATDRRSARRRRAVTSVPQRCSCTCRDRRDRRRPASPPRSAPCRWLAPAG